MVGRTLKGAGKSLVPAKGFLQPACHSGSRYDLASQETPIFGPLEFEVGKWIERREDLLFSGQLAKTSQSPLYMQDPEGSGYSG